MGAVSRVSQLALRMHTARAVFRSAVRDANHPTSVFARKIRVFANSSGRHGEAAPARGSWRNETVPRSFRTCTALYEKSTGTTTAGNETAHTLNDTADASSQKIIRHNSVGDADSATVAAADAALQSKRDVADTLKILKVVKAVRTRGHLSARLDPLGRSLGPLIEGYESMETSVPDGGADIARLMNYPNGLFLRGRRVNPGQYLGLHDTRPGREFYFADELASLDSSALDKKKQWWSLREVLRKLRGAYCGTLSAEFEHLNSAPKKKWMRTMLEGHARDFFADSPDKKEGLDVKLADSKFGVPWSVGASASASASQIDELDDLATTFGEAKQKWQSGGPVDGVRRLEGLWLNFGEKKRLLRRVLTAERLELFLGKQFPSAKRFGLEGAETLIPGLQALVETCAANGATQIVMGMAHRGRLNILSNVFAKPLALICAEMRSEGTSDFNVGDVRYHLGARALVKVPFGGDDDLPGIGNGAVPNDSTEKPSVRKTVEMTMAPNPSHLEAVNCVAAGMVRSKQVALNPTVGRGGGFGGFGVGAFGKKNGNGDSARTTSTAAREQVLGITLHGDAAFCGLGANAETMQLQDLPEYTTGGTIHVIVNNQIGFTTVPRRARSSPHPSDVAKGYGAPIFHVNGDDPEAVVRGFRLAGEYRHKFQSDVVVNFICYRRLGHNEQDDPSITLPLRAAAIAAQPRVGTTYGARLITENVCTRAKIDDWIVAIDLGFENELKNSHGYVESAEDWAVSAWRRPTGQKECNVGENFGDQSFGDRDGAATSNTSEHPAFIVEDGLDGPQARLKHKPTLTTTPIDFEGGQPKEYSLKSSKRYQNQRAVTTGVPLPLLRALGMAVTELPEEKEEFTKDGNTPDDDDDSDSDHDESKTSPRRVAAQEAMLIAQPQKTLFPQNFVPHPHVRKLLKQRRAMVASPEMGVGEVANGGGHNAKRGNGGTSNENGVTSKYSLPPRETPGVDWGTAELLAFGSLLLQTENDKFHCHVRLSGQDVERGTFNHRHAVLYCSRTSVGVNPLDNLGLGRQDRFVVSNSPLSEHAVLGFEYGYSVDAGHGTLVVWEAQFGDFANNAQCVVDQFISSGEAKWGQRSGIVLLLPHGHDGQGPDHSSARPERWLAAANDDPDTTPGRSPADVLLATRTYAAITAQVTTGVDTTGATSAVLNLEKFRERVEALEREAGGDSFGNDENLDEDLFAVSRSFPTFDEHGGLIAEDESSLGGGDGGVTGNTGNHYAQTHGDDDSTVKTDGKHSAKSKRKADAARAMLDDVCAFVSRETGCVDEVVWSRYTRHRARRGADASANFVVISPSTPAQYFHALRRQALAPHRKPMIVLAPKYLLHHRPCVSPLPEFGPKTRFRAVIADGDRGDNLNTGNTTSGTGTTVNTGTTASGTSDPAAPLGHRKIILCTGKTYYVLAHARKTRKLEQTIALIRIEQLFPFPHEALAKRLRRYGHDAEIVWAQEEPKNMGFWAFVQPRVETALRELVVDRMSCDDGDGDSSATKTKAEKKIRYVGRPASASPASGSQTIHARETKAFVDEALG